MQNLFLFTRSAAKHRAETDITDVHMWTLLSRQEAEKRTKRRKSTTHFLSLIKAYLFALVNDEEDVFNFNIPNVLD